MQSSIDVMLDLETCGTSPGCIILSIGACTFDKVYNTYQRIHTGDSMEAGFWEDPETMRWWNKQNPAIREEAFSGGLPILDALGSFSDFMLLLKKQYKNVYIWGNGADFDLPILAYYYTKMDMKIPWEPYNGRCYRTLKNLYKDIKIGENSGKHNALEDARTQADHAYRILKEHFTKFQD